MTRVLSHDRNVVAVDFRPSRNITVTIHTEILYADGSIVLARTTYLHDGKPILPQQHFLADLSAGKTIST
jgi:hypothetical protein